MNSISLEALGITKADLENRIVEKAVEDLLSGVEFDEDGDEWRSRSQLAKKMDAMVKQRIDETVNRLADQYVLPNVATYIENLTLQATNKWGEKTGSTMTFIEYLTQRAEAYISEQVDHNGKSKSESDSYGWSGRTSRVSYMVDEHLHYSIEAAMKQALATANSQIKGGLETAVKMSLEQVLAKLRVDVKTS